MSQTAFHKRLDRADVAYERLPHRHTESAWGEARALSLPVEMVAKTIVVETPQGDVRVVLSAADRLDLGKLKRALSLEEARLMPEGRMAREYPEFEPGAVPPLGGREDAVVVDCRVADSDEVVLEAGSHEESLKLATDDLIAATKATVADVVHA